MRYKSANNAAEAETIMLLHRGDEKALILIFNYYHLPLFYFARQFFNNSLTAENVVAESFYQLWERKEEFRSLDAVKTFLYTSVKDACCKTMKQVRHDTGRHEKTKELADTGESFAALAGAKMIKAELLRRIMEDIEYWSSIRRKIFKMLFIDGLDAFEVAGILKIPVDTVRVQKAKSLHMLRTIAREKLR